MLLVLSLPAPAGRLLIQLARQRVQSLLDENIMRCKLYGGRKAGESRRKSGHGGAR